MSTLYFDAGPACAGQKVLLATTAYDSPDASYTFSIARSREALSAAGIQSAYLLLQGNCHVDDARNTVIRDFLDTDCTEMVFLDADVSWEPEQLVTLCTYDCDIVGGVYPYRRDGQDEKMPVRNIPGVFIPDDKGLLEVEGLPTGFLRIKRHVIEAMVKGCVTFSKDNGKPIPLLFERDIYNGGRRGGDIGFCMKWRDMGGRLYAAANLRLGHCGKHVIRDSLAASLRRQMRLSLRHVADKVKQGTETKDDLAEAVKYIANNWGASLDVLSLSVLLARKATGPILETGSGLTTIMMAAARPDLTVWVIEHDKHFEWKLEQMAREAGVSNIAIVSSPIRNGWYDIGEDRAAMPDHFSVALVDGPPRLDGDRMKFFDVFGDCVDVVLADDADDRGYEKKLSDWASSNGKTLHVDKRAAVMLPEGVKYGD